MAYNDTLMLVKVDFEKGAIGTRHHHPHLQISYVAKVVVLKQPLAKMSKY
jgi:hypothetical protein